MTRALVFGAGRMARSVIALAGDYPQIDLVGQVSRTAPKRDDRPGTKSGDQPTDGVSTDPAFFDSLDAAAQALEGNFDLVIDFSLPEGTRAAATWCAGRRVALLSGVTGIDDEVQAALDVVAESAPVLWAANLSFGINLLAGLLDDLGKAVDDATPVTIEETHHAGKKDAPSGTALLLARHLRAPAGDKPGMDPGWSAEAFPGIEFRSHREGEVVGDHSITVAMRDETLTLSHHAVDRRLFARGALEAGLWLSAQPPGRYSAADWIGSVVASNGQGRPPSSRIQTLR